MEGGGWASVSNLCEQEVEDYLGDWQTLGVAYVSMSQHFESADIPGQHSDVSPGHGQTRPPLMASKLLISLLNDGTAHQVT